MITQLGIESNPWQMEAKIRSGTGHPQAVLGGTTTVVSDNGWFNFTGMFISHAATGYYIDFDIIMPSTAVGKYYCKCRNFRKNFIFTNIVKRHMFQVKN